jgi:serine/threonine protein kinase
MPVLAGWALKQSRWLGVMRRRWIVLNASEIISFTDEHGVDPTERFSLATLRAHSRYNAPEQLHLHVVERKGAGTCGCQLDGTCMLVFDDVRCADLWATAILNRQLSALPGGHGHYTDTSHVHSFEACDLVAFEDRYRLGPLIEDGSFGSIHHATCRQTGRAVAVKLCTTSTVAKRTMVRAETRAMLEAAARHPKLLCELINLFEGVTRWCLVMPLYAGGTLHDHILRYYRPLGQAVAEGDTGKPGACDYDERHVGRIMRQVVAAIEALHACGWLHLDLKPQNILLTDQAARGMECVRLCDFGMAMRMENAQGASGQVVLGTPGYAPPEALRGEGYGRHSDIWGLGLLGYIMCSGHQPFQHDDEREQERLTREASWSFNHPHWASVSTDGKAWVSMALVQRAEQRALVTELLQHVWLSSSASSASATNRHAASTSHGRRLTSKSKPFWKLLQERQKGLAMTNRAVAERGEQGGDLRIDSTSREVA